MDEQQFNQYAAGVEDGITLERERVLDWFKALMVDDNLDFVQVIVAVKEGHFYEEKV